jgi:hypothetical protein
VFYELQRRGGMGGGGEAGAGNRERGDVILIDFGACDSSGEGDRMMRR